MEKLINKYKDLIADELFKATYDETIEFCMGLESFLSEIRMEAQEAKKEYEKGE